MNDKTDGIGNTERLSEYRRQPATEATITECTWVVGSEIIETEHFRQNL